MSRWLNYTGWDTISEYSFKLGADGDVLNIPCGIRSVSWGFEQQPNSQGFGVTLYIHGEDGGTDVLHTEGNYTDNVIFNYSTNGWSTASVALPGFWGTIKYNKDVNTFWGTGSSELIVQDDLYQKNDGSYAWNYNKNIYLSGEKGWQSYGGITDINARYSSGTNELWGDGQNNKITAGSGNSTLFGGWGGDDTLTGGSGSDLFIYERDGGHDVVNNAQGSDTIWLFNSNPWETNYYYDNVNNVMHLYSGSGELEVNCSTGDYWYPHTYPVYHFADGTRFTYEPSNNSWNGVSWDAAEDAGSNIADSQLWHKVNTFYGTDDTDDFFLSRYDSNDQIFNAAQEDTIHLYDTALSDIVATSVNDNVIAVQFSTGENLQVSTTENISPTFKLASGESYLYNRETSAWQEA